MRIDSNFWLINMVTIQSFATLTTRQRNGALETRKNTKKVKALVSKCSQPQRKKTECHNQCLKLGPKVAAVLSCAQSIQYSQRLYCIDNRQTDEEQLTLALSLLLTGVEQLLLLLLAAVGKLLLLLPDNCNSFCWVCREFSI